ncbi:prolipoprotein diacylglyceryl transferase [Chloroflexota bacterium]
MNGIVINIDPALFRLGDFVLAWYSLAIILGIAAGEIQSLALWVVISGVVGARLFHVVDRWEYYAGNPLYIFQLQQGGLVIWGALVGGAVALSIYAKSLHLPLGRLLDAVVPGLLVAQIIGRIGCIVNGDAYGGITNLPWAFIYTHPSASIPGNLFGMPTHPYPVYEMVWNAIALMVIWRLDRHFKKEGLVFLSYLVLYSLGRFILTFVRQENQFFWGLQQAQVIAIAALVILVGVLIYLSKKGVVRNNREEQDAYSFEDVTE